MGEPRNGHLNYPSPENRRLIQLLLKNLSKIVIGLMAISGFWAGDAGITIAATLGQSPESAARAGSPQDFKEKDKDKDNKDKDSTGTVSSSSSEILPNIDLKTYRIGIEDELMISVWREPELSNQVVVRPDGKITLPLINDISVVGLKTTELQSLLTEKFRPFVNTPQVTVIVRGIRSRKVSLVGNVGHQGSFSLNDRKTILELLAEAGGLGPFARTNAIYILRDVDAKKVRIPFDYKKAISGRGPNPELQPGDLIVVP